MPPSLDKIAIGIFQGVLVVDQTKKPFKKGKQIRYGGVTYSIKAVKIGDRSRVGLVI